MISKCISGVLVCAATAVLAAQTPSPYSRAEEKAFRGVIKTVGSYPAEDGAVGVHIDLTTDEGIVDVRVAPAMFIGQNNFWFFADEPLVVIGARVTADQSAPVWARAVQKGSSVLVLRSEDGTPKWTPPTNGTDGCGVNHPPLQRTTLH
jgi:hypothetical protein